MSGCAKQRLCPLLVEVFLALSSVVVHPSKQAISEPAVVGSFFRAIFTEWRLNTAMATACSSLLEVKRVHIADRCHSMSKTEARHERKSKGVSSNAWHQRSGSGGVAGLSR